jgi:hypothetical protein
MAHTIRAAKAAAGGRALDIYAIAQRLVKSADGAEAATARAKRSYHALRGAGGTRVG